MPGASGEMVERGTSESDTVEEGELRGSEVAIGSDCYSLEE